MMRNDDGSLTQIGTEISGQKYKKGHHLDEYSYEDMDEVTHLAGLVCVGYRRGYNDIPVFVGILGWYSAYTEVFQRNRNVGKAAGRVGNIIGVPMDIMNAVDNYAPDDFWYWWDNVWTGVSYVNYLGLPVGLYLQIVVGEGTKATVKTGVEIQQSTNNYFNPTKSGNIFENVYGW